MRFLIYSVVYLATFIMTSDVMANDVNGTVTEKGTGDPVYGAAIYVKGTKIGTIAERDGTWSLSDVPHDDFVLVFEMAGYQAVEIETTGGVVHAQLEVAMFNVGEVVVTGTQTKYLYEEAPVKTEVVPKRQIEAVEEADLFGLLQYTPGVRVENNCQNCGFSQLRMLGLEGGYSQILIDGDPVVSTMAGVYGLQQFPEQMVESLEIVKGGGSALYGANAIGGVVNIRLRRPMLNASKVTFDYKVADDGHVRSESGFFSETVSDDGDYGIFIFGSAREQNGYDRNDDGYTDISRMRGETLGFNMYYKFSPQQELTAHFHRLHDDRRGGDDLDKPSHQADISEAAESYRWGGNLKYSHTVNQDFSYTAGYSFALANRDSYYGAGQDPNAYGRSENPVHYFSGMAHYTVGGHHLTGGITYSMENLRDEAVSYDRLIEDEYNDFGIILQDDITFLDRYTIVAGARLDKHSLLDDPIISPRISAMMNVTDAWKLRGSVSTGFKPPQIFDEDLHITQVGGEGQILTNVSGLKEEKSLSFSGTIDYIGMVESMPAQFGVTAFRTILDDQFQMVEADDPETDYFEFERINGDGLAVSGIEVQAGLMPVPQLELQGSFTLQSNKLDSPEPDFGSTHLFRTPEQYGNVVAYYNPHHRVSLFGGLNYTGEMKAPHYAGYIATDRLETTDAFVTLDIGVTYELLHSERGDGSTVLKCGVKNVADEYQEDLDYGIDRGAGYLYGPAVPRTLYASIEFGI